MPVPAALPLLQRAGINLAGPRSAEDVIKNTSVTLTIAQLHALASKPNAADFMQHLGAFLSPSADPRAASTSVHSSGHDGNLSPRVGTTAPDGHPPSGATTYKSALTGLAPVRKQLVDMGELDMTMGHGEQRVTRVAKIDNGSQICTISQAAYERDRLLFGAEAVIYSLRGVPVRMASDHAPPATAPALVQNANVRIGRALYKLDLLIMPQATAEYTLGQDFLWQYHVTPCAYLGRCWLAMEGSRDRQWVPMRVRSQIAHWPIVGPPERLSPLSQP
jgi:hypothetical protein